MPRAAQADEVEVVADRKARRPALDQHAADAAEPRRVTDAHQHEEDIGHLRGGAPHLAAVDDQLVALDGGACLECRQVRPGIGLGHAPGRKQLAAGQARQVPALHLLAADVLDDARRRTVGAAEQDRGIRADARHLLDHDHQLGQAEARAAVGFRDRHSQEAVVRQHFQVGHRRLAVAVGSGGAGGEAFTGDCGDRLADQPLLGAEFDLHDAHTPFDAGSIGMQSMLIKIDLN